MNSPVCGLRLVSIFAGLGCLVHLVRLFVGFPIVINSVTVPVWFSGVAFVVLGLLSFWFWKLSLAVKPATPAASTAV
jgi:hypothetical protein